MLVYQRVRVGILKIPRKKPGGLMNKTDHIYIWANCWFFIATQLHSFPLDVWENVQENPIFHWEKSHGFLNVLSWVSRVRLHLVLEIASIGPVRYENWNLFSKWVCLKIVVYPEKPNGFADHYPYEKWLFHWGYTPFSDIPKWPKAIFSQKVFIVLSKYLPFPQKKKVSKFCVN